MVDLRSPLPPLRICSIGPVNHLAVRAIQIQVSFPALSWRETAAEGDYSLFRFTVCLSIGVACQRA